MRTRRKCKNPIKRGSTLWWRAALSIAVGVGGNIAWYSSFLVDNKPVIIPREDRGPSYNAHLKRVLSPVEDEKRLKEMQTSISDQLGRKNYEACRWLSSRSEIQNRAILEACSNSDNPRVYYNPLKRERYLCGVKIKAGSLLRLDQGNICNGPVTLFPVTPALDGEGMPPVTLRFQMSPPAPFPDCDIPCYESGEPPPVAVRTVDPIDGGDAWSFMFSMEGAAYYPNLEIEPEKWKDNKFYATTSFESEIPLPYFSWEEYNLHGSAVDFDEVIKGAVFLARNCGSINDRERIVEELQSLPFRVDSLSLCLRNAEPPPGVDLDGTKEDILKHYMFYLAFENQCLNDYITEKLWQPFSVGSIPVYYGAANVKLHVPNNSIIHIDDFPDTKALARHLNKVANDRALYESYQAWRTKPLPAHFHSKYNISHTHSTCRMCRWVYARQYGLGWNQTTQSLQDLQAGPRHVCLNENGLIRQPFQETWLAFDGSEVDTFLRNGDVEDPCRLSDNNRDLLIDQGRVRRIVRDHDGVVDMYLERTGENVTGSFVLQIQTHLVQAKSPKRVRDGMWLMQDETVRFSLLTLPRRGAAKLEAAGSSQSGGAMNVIILASSLPVCLRLIVEDIDTFHQGADKEVNFFANLMADDFYNPVELFVEA